MAKCEITDVRAREIIDSRGNPTVEAVVTVDDRIQGVAACPSGASTGKYEAVELRDGKCTFEQCEREHWKDRYNGNGVLQAVDNVNVDIRRSLVGHCVLEHGELDNMMIKLDGTDNKGKLGANAILSVSLAAARAGAKVKKMPLYKYIGGISASTMPVPMMNIINGGVHAKNNLDFQEFMIIPVPHEPDYHCCFRESLRMGTEVYQHLKGVLAKKGLSTAVGDEGGFAPDVKDAKEALDILVTAIKEAGYTPGKDIYFAMDAAASELHQADSGMYYFPGESKAKCESLESGGKKDAEGCGCNTQEVAAHQPDTICTHITRSTDEMIEYYKELVNEYPIISIEDPLDEEDWDGWKKITDVLGDRIQLVGDDLFVTNCERLKKGIEMGCANSILIKLNQIGTLSETMDAIRLAKTAGYTAIVSHRSGETEDTTIADLAVALNTGQIKTGAPCRSERVSKYNRLIRIEEELGVSAAFPGIKAFRTKR